MVEARPPEGSVYKPPPLQFVPPPPSQPAAPAPTPPTAIEAPAAAKPAAEPPPSGTVDAFILPAKAEKQPGFAKQGIGLPTCVFQQALRLGSPRGNGLPALELNSPAAGQ